MSIQTLNLEDLRQGPSGRLLEIKCWRSGIRVDWTKNNMTQKWMVAFIVFWLGAIAAANAQTKSESTRGELLYATHCISCHSTQIHWRDKKVAKDWGTLKAEVGRWQKASELGWSEEDVTDVARYLDTLHYHFPVPALSRSPAGDTIQLTHQN